jgi:hypothetical protein
VATRRPAEEAALDPWAEQMTINAKRELALAEADIRERETKADRRHELWVGVLTGLAVLTGLGIIVGGIVALAFHFDVDEDERVRLRIQEAEARAEGVAHCLQLEEPAERQLCVISLGLPDENNEDEEGDE